MDSGRQFPFPLRRLAPVSSLTLAALLALSLLAGDAAAVGLNERCGGVGPACDAGLWCEPPYTACGIDNAQGRCSKLVERCSSTRHPVCGCDNKTYRNDCLRQMAKVTKQDDGACK